MASKNRMAWIALIIIGGIGITSIVQNHRLAGRLDTLEANSAVTHGLVLSNQSTLATISSRFGTGSDLTTTADIYVAVINSRDKDGDGLAGFEDCDDADRPKHRGLDTNNDGCTDMDTDSDGLMDHEDKCDTEKPAEGADVDGDGCTDADTDGDGLMDPVDMCDDDKPAEGEDTNGDGCTDTDEDKDGIPDHEDECPTGHHGDTDPMTHRAKVKATSGAQLGCFVKVIPPRPTPRGDDSQE